MRNKLDELTLEQIVELGKDTLRQLDNEVIGLKNLSEADSAVSQFAKAECTVQYYHRMREALPEVKLSAHIILAQYQEKASKYNDVLVTKRHGRANYSAVSKEEVIDVKTLAAIVTEFRAQLILFKEQIDLLDLKMKEIKCM